MSKDDIFLSSQEKIARLVEYARGSKTPSVWWNGIEYKWDKKRGKYLHWTTQPNGEKHADEPPYEATNPLFAAVGIEAEENEPKKETTAPKEEKKVEKKDEPPKEEPQEEPQSEPSNEQAGSSSASSIFATFSDSMSPEEQEKTIKDWANAFFDGGEKLKSKGKDVPLHGEKIEKILSSFFLDDAVPLYAKRFLLNEMNLGGEEFQGRESGVLEKFDTLAEGLDEGYFNRDINGYGSSYMFAEKIGHSCNATWDYLTKSYNGNDEDRGIRQFYMGGEPIVGRFSQKPLFGDINLPEQQRTISECRTRESAFDNIAKIALIPDEQLTPELRNTLDFYSKIATKQTTTDYESAAILSAIADAGLAAAYARRSQDKNYDGSAEYYKDFLEKRISRDVLQEIASRKTLPASQTASPTPQETTIRPLIPKDRDEARLDDVFDVGRDNLRSKNLGYYSDLCELWRDPQKFKLSEEQFEWFSKAKDVIEDPDVLPELRSDVLEAANTCYNYGHVSSWQGYYDNLARRIKFADKDLSFSEAMKIASLRVMDQYFTPKGKTAQTRDELIKAASSYRNIPELGGERNARIRLLEKRLLTLAKEPTTRDSEVVNLVARIGEINQKAKDLDKNIGKYLRDAKSFGLHERVDNLQNELIKGGDRILKDLDNLVASTAILKERADGANPARPPKTPAPEPEPSKIGEKPLPPMTSNGQATTNQTKIAHNADDFTAAVEKVRSENMSPEEAEQDRKATEAEVVEFQTLTPALAELRDVQRRRAAFTQEQYDKIDDVNRYIDKMVDKMSRPLTSAEREKNLSFLRAAFPDRGGSSFFTKELYDDFRRNTLDFFRNHGLPEEDASYVLDVYDILGKSFNLSGKTDDPPLIVGVALSKRQSKDTGGSFSREWNTIKLNTRRDASPGVQASLMHELGHWLENNILGNDVMRENLDWLTKETGTAAIVKRNIGKSKDYQIPHKKNPLLCCRFDGYSMKVYAPRNYHDADGNVRSDYGSTEAFSTGMEGLGLFPSFFAQGVPKHFNRMLECLKKLEQN